MTDNNNNLYLYEAIELRSEYDQHIALLVELLGVSTLRRSGFSFDKDDEGKDPAADFDQKVIDSSLKKLQSKRVMLNQEIQKTNFNTQIQYDGAPISIAQALEIRKNLLNDIKAIAGRVEKSSYRRVIHKEGRDIVQEPRHKFTDTYKAYQESLRLLRYLVTQIHAANHTATVSYKDE